MRSAGTSADEGGEQAGHRDRRHRAKREVQPGEAGDAADRISCPTVRRRGVHDVLRPHVGRSGGDHGRRPESGHDAGSEPAGRRPADAAAADSRKTCSSIDLSARCRPRSPCWPRCSQRSGSTVCWPTPSRSGRKNRAAHGARRAPGRVRGMVLKQVALMMAVGGAIGLTAAVWVGSIAGALLFEMKGWDPLVLASAAVGLTLVALAAGYAPAQPRRAHRSDARAQVRMTS